MRIKRPSRSVFIVSLIFAVVGLLAHIGSIPVLSSISFWLVLFGYVLLFLGVAVKGF
ncbi:MAG: hypothetical protein P8Z42_03275 [Anaerolineales bacterium]|jgi:hypothetical protein